MMRSRDPRSTARSLTIGKARARHWLQIQLVAVFEMAHVQLAQRGPGSGPCATPLIMNPHMPQIPRGQS